MTMIKVLIVLLMTFSFNAYAIELKVQKVTDSIYALVGETGARTDENFASNNTVGFIVAKEGVILVGTGAMNEGAQLIANAIATVTHLPIKWVINIGTQDHHWMGNEYFRNKNIDIYALKRTVNSQKEHVDDHLTRLKNVMGEKALLIKPQYANKAISSDHKTIVLGGINVELFWPGNGHFPGDAVLWVPQQKTIFTGDFVYIDRILGIHPFTSVTQWQKALTNVSKLKPKHVIPGHGRATTWSQVQSETIDYLAYLLKGVRAVQEDWLELDETIDKLSDAPQFSQLVNFESWHRLNIHRTYMQLEAE